MHGHVHSALNLFSFDDMFIDKLTQEKLTTSTTGTFN